MNQSNPTYDSAKYLYVLTPSVSYRKLSNGIKFYFHYRTRADWEMLVRLKQKILAVGVFGLLFIPLIGFGFHSPAWPIILGALLLWLIYIMQMGCQLLLKMCGLETLYITKHKIELIRCVHWGNRRWNLSRYILQGKATFTSLNQPIKKQSFLGIGKNQVIKILHPSPDKSSPEIGLKVSEEDFQKIYSLIKNINLE